MASNYHSVALMAILFLMAVTTQGAVKEPEDWVEATFDMTGTSYTDALHSNTSDEYSTLKTKIEDTIANALSVSDSAIVAVNLTEAVHKNSKATVTVSVGLTGITDKTKLTDTVDAALKAIATDNNIDSATIVVTAPQTTTVDPDATTAAPGNGGGGGAGGGGAGGGGGSETTSTVDGSGTGTTAAGSDGGTTAAGSDGGTTAAGSAGGTTAAGSAGGTTAAGSAGVTTAAAGSGSGGGGSATTTGVAASGGDSESGGTTGTAGSTGSGSGDSTSGSSNSGSSSSGTGSSGSSSSDSSSTPKKVDEDITKGDVSFVDVKEGFVKRAPKTSYLLTVTAPAFIGVLFMIIVLLCCTTADSCFCNICSSDPKNVP